VPGPAAKAQTQVRTARARDVTTAPPVMEYSLARHLAPCLGSPGSPGCGAELYG